MEPAQVVCTSIYLPANVFGVKKKKPHGGSSLDSCFGNLQTGDSVLYNYCPARPVISQIYETTFCFERIERDYLSKLLNGLRTVALAELKAAK